MPTERALALSVYIVKWIPTSLEIKVGMSAAYRENARNCEELAYEARDAPSWRRLMRLASGWRAVAETQDWLDGAIPPVGIRMETTMTANGDSEGRPASTDRPENNQTNR